MSTAKDFVEVFNSKNIILYVHKSYVAQEPSDAYLRSWPPPLSSGLSVAMVLDWAPNSSLALNN